CPSRHTEALLGRGCLRPGFYRYTDSLDTAIRRGAGVARAPGAMGTVAAALVVRRRRMGAGRGLRRARGRRPAMVRVIQTNQGNPLRAVGHHALRPAVRTTRAGILAGGCRGAVNGSRGLTARPLDEQGPLRNS